MEHDMFFLEYGRIVLEKTTGLFSVINKICVGLGNSYMYVLKKTS
jgi:hypothetical protein